jgi:ABC-type transport system substrate-binding protein
LSYRQACYDFNGTEDENERKEIMQNLEQRISDECPYICLFRDYSYETTSSRVSNILPGKYDACWTWEVE